MALKVTSMNNDDDDRYFHEKVMYEDYCGKMGGPRKSKKPTSAHI